MTLHAMCARVMRGAACSPRKRSARRAARDASTRLVLPFVLLQMVATLLFPSGAFALSPNDEGVLWGPTRVGIDTSGIVVCTTNNFDAALWAIGRWNTKIQLDHPKFVLLSNEDTGGHFYELASYFHSYAEVGTPDWPNAMAVEGYAIMCGPDNTWLASVPSSLISQAREDYNTVLHGGSLGGGGSGLSSSLRVYPNYSFTVGTASGVDRRAYWTFYVGDVAYTTRLKKDGTAYEYSDRTSVLLQSPLVISLPDGFDYNLPDGYDSDDVYYYLSNVANAKPSIRFFLKSKSRNSTLAFTDCTISSTDGAVKSFAYLEGSLSYDYAATRAFDFVSCDGSLMRVAFTSTDSGPLVWTADNDGVYNSTSANTACIGYGGSESGGGGGDNHWPTDDPTPTPDPPEVPGPSDDPVVEPDPPDLPNPVTYPVSDPYTPDPDPPANPVVTYDPNPTGDATDYRPWLNAILVLLRKINTTLSDGFGDLRGWLTNHCDHIREQIHSDSVDLGLHIQTAIQNGFVSFERWLQGTFAGYFIDELDYVIGQQFAELESYLYDLFHWLASQFDFTFGGTNYDDSSVIYWLRRIFARLGGGAPNPGDDGTVDESFDWWSWLLGLITDALGGIITDFVGDVGGFLATLADVFPFSIPGDIVAYLTLLDAARETPRFVVTIPAVQGWWQSFDYEIDLSPFDDAMGVVRGMYLIYWGLILVMKTDWLGGVFDFASRAVVQFFDKITGGAYSA